MGPNYYYCIYCKQNGILKQIKGNFQRQLQVICNFKTITFIHSVTAMQNPSTQMLLLGTLQAQVQKPDTLYNHQALTVYLTDTSNNITAVKGRHCQDDYYSQSYNNDVAK